MIQLLTVIMKYKWILLVALLAIIIVAIIWLSADNKRLRQELYDTQIELTVKTSETKLYKDKYGRIHAKVDQYAKTIGELKTSNDSIERKLYENARAAGIKDRQIKELKYALFMSRDSITGIIYDHAVDTINIDDLLIEYVRNVEFDNGNLRANLIVPMVETKPYSLIYEYSAEAFITERWYRPKSKFFLFRWMGVSFKKKVNEFDFRLSDSNATIKVTRDIMVE
jgi:hypothetical protein